MELIIVRLTLSFLAEIGITVPFIFAIYAWANLKAFQKYYVCYMALCLVISSYSFLLYSQGRSTLFLDLYQPIADCLLLLQMVRLFKSDHLKKLILISGLGCLILTIWDLISYARSGKSNNPFFSVSINLLISFYGGLFLTNIIKLPNRHSLNALDLFITLQLMMTFFVKTVFNFFKQYLFETQVNFYIYMQVENLLSIVNIIWILIISWAFHQCRHSPNWKPNE